MAQKEGKQRASWVKTGARVSKQSENPDGKFSGELNGSEPSSRLFLQSFFDQAYVFDIMAMPIRMHVLSLLLRPYGYLEFA